MKVRAVGTMLALAVAGGVTAGSQAPTALSFEAASIKQNRSGDDRTDGVDVGNRFRMTNETLWRLIGEAYATPTPLPRFRIVGGPSWIESDRFDVDAVTDGTSATDRKRLMLRTLLADRFQLVAHVETREFETYDLVPARSDGRPGEKLRLSTVNCSALPAPNAPPVTLPPDQPRPCMMNFGRSQISAIGMTTQNLSNMLSRYVNRVVVDRTGRTEGFDWTLEWEALGQTPGTVGVSIFTALQEQLGLKLEPTRGPVEFLVIDRVERPTPD